MGRRERGFALFIVVAVLALMAALVADFVTLAQTDIRATRNEVELARARNLAEAGYAMALNDLLNPELGRAALADGRSREVEFDGGRISIAIQDEAGKIDLNWAPMELLSGLLDGLEIPGDVAARIIDAVADRRAGIALPQYAPGDIAASGLLGGPTLARLAHMPFASVDELQALARVDQASFDRMLPALTVYSESRRVNLSVAPRAVLMAIPGVSAEMADAIIASRKGGAGGALPVAAAQRLDNGGGYTGVGGLRAATITADAVTAGGVRFERRAVVSFTGIPLMPVRVLEWREGN
jgi:general secretion pathway protein K